MRKTTILALAVTIVLSSCSANKNISILSSLPDNSDSLHIEKQISFAKSATGHADVIIHENQTAQTVEGVGAALTHASAYVFNKNMTPAKRDSLFRVLFTPEGIGINYTRLCVGASDFATDLFSYSEAEDFTLSNFSIARDETDVLPMLKEMLAINPDMQIIASPWSPPAWMKTNGSMVGGKLRPDCYSVYADYLIKFIEAYQERGIKIHGLTVQNEPEFGTAAYSCMDMTAEEQKIFIRDHLGPKMTAKKMDTKIILFDHNCDNPGYPISIMNDPEAKKYVAGSGFHLYKGEISALCTVHDAHPDKDLYFTEQSGGGWAPDFDQNIRWNVGELIIGAMNCWSKNVLLWNLALDENHGPKNFGCQDCYGVVHVNTDGSIVKKAEYYALGHYGKYVQPNALRLVSEAKDLKGAAFKNPDGSLVYMAVYYGKTSREMQIQCGEKQFSYTFRPGEVVTFKF